MKLRKGLPPDLVENIALLAADGYGAALIADILGTSRHTINRYAKGHGIALPARSRPELCAYSGISAATRQRAQETKAKWIEWSGGKERLIDAAARLGISKCGLSKRIARWGVEKAMRLPRQSTGPVVPNKMAADHIWRVKKKKAA